MTQEQKLQFRRQRIGFAILEELETLDREPATVEDRERVFTRIKELVLQSSEDGQEPVGDDVIRAWMTPLVPKQP